MFWQAVHAQGRHPVVGVWAGYFACDCSCVCKQNFKTTSAAHQVKQHELCRPSKNSSTCPHPVSKKQRKAGHFCLPSRRAHTLKRRASQRWNFVFRTLEVKSPSLTLFARCPMRIISRSSFFIFFFLSFFEWCVCLVVWLFLFLFFAAQHSYEESCPGPLRS